VLARCLIRLRLHLWLRSVILWTRVTPKGGKNKPAFLDYCVSRTRDFRKCEARGTTITDQNVDFTAKVLFMHHLPGSLVHALGCATSVAKMLPSQLRKKIVCCLPASSSLLCTVCCGFWVLTG
jgi:PhoD-like phosphatase, N-terminal domain